ncbi:MAG: PAS domain S-box protein [Caldilineaceae bacterium]
MLGFDAVVETKYWIDFDLKLLQVMGDVIVHALQRRAVESALRKSEEQLSLLGANSRELSYIFDTHSMRYTYLSSAIERIWGYPVEEARSGLAFTESVMHPDDAHVLEEMRAKLLEHHQESTEAEYRIMRFHRWKRPLVWDRATAVRGADGEAHSVVGVVEDITEQKQATQQLTESAERLSVLAAIGQYLVNNVSSSAMVRRFWPQSARSYRMMWPWLWTQQEINWIEDDSGAPRQFCPQRRAFTLPPKQHRPLRRMQAQSRTMPLHAQ